jgi:hypothetical protein
MEGFGHTGRGQVPACGTARGSASGRGCVGSGVLKRLERAGGSGCVVTVGVGVGVAVGWRAGGDAGAAVRGVHAVTRCAGVP